MNCQFFKLMITLPVLLLPLSAIGAGFAKSETVSADEAVRLLAAARAADAKCGILNAAEREELAGYVARAEIATAERISVSAARDAIAAGTARGKASSCEEAQAQVNETLSAARDAMASLAADGSGVGAPSAPERRSVEPEPQQADQKQPRLLARYAASAEAYYLERRCTYLSRREISDFYAAIVATHRAAVSRFGKTAVQAVMTKAEAKASRHRCNAQAEMRIAAAFRSVR
jgi:hypothetical protein